MLFKKMKWICFTSFLAEIICLRNFSFTPNEIMCLIILFIVQIITFEGSIKNFLINYQDKVDLISKEEKNGAYKGALAMVVSLSLVVYSIFSNNASFASIALTSSAFIAALVYFLNSIFKISINHMYDNEYE